MNRARSKGARKAQHKGAWFIYDNIRQHYSAAETQDLTTGLWFKQRPLTKLLRVLQPCYATLHGNTPFLFGLALHSTKVDLTSLLQAAFQFFGFWS